MRRSVVRGSRSIGSSGERAGVDIEHAARAAVDPARRLVSGIRVAELRVDRDLAQLGRPSSELGSNASSLRPDAAPQRHKKVRARSSRRRCVVVPQPAVISSTGGDALNAMHGVTVQVEPQAHAGRQAYL